MVRILFAGLILCQLALSVRPDLKVLPIGSAPSERGLRLGPAPETVPPVGPVRSLAEWEEATAAMTLWTNPSLVAALSKRGKVKIIADSRLDQSWWENWLQQNGIESNGISFFHMPTDSIWVRDYGPWFILDGNRQFGIVDTKYNRPRPRDDLVPVHIAKELQVPYYQPGLVHTGGNYYNDSLGNAFSSTLVYTENSSLSKTDIHQRMQAFLGIDRYTTSRLAPGMTIQHIDTFGKLVAPDTWVFSDFPQGSPFRADSEAMVALLKTLKSPYGTPYKIHRLKMVDRDSRSFRAYINSFISNRALYFPAYGDSKDDEAKAVYQKALPGYEIVPVKALGTQWGDSVHCRTRNLIESKTLFLFPHVEKKGEEIYIRVEAIPSPGSDLRGTPQLHWTVDGISQAALPMVHETENWYSLKVPFQGLHLQFWISAVDSSGKKKTAPLLAPKMTIDYTADS